MSRSMSKFDGRSCDIIAAVDRRRASRGRERLVQPFPHSLAGAGTFAAWRDRPAAPRLHGILTRVRATENGVHPKPLPIGYRRVATPRETMIFPFMF